MWFFAPHSLTLGDNLDCELKEAAQGCQEFHLFWSEESAMSEWVRREVEWALAAPERPRFAIYELDDSDTRRLEALIGNTVRHDYRAETLWPRKHVWIALITALALVTGGALVMLWLPGALAHVLLYFLISIAGIGLAAWLWLMKEWERSVTCLNVTVLGLMDFIAWKQVLTAWSNNVVFPDILRALDWLAYALFLAGMALISVSPYLLPTRPRLSRTVAPATLLVALYSACTMCYWIVVADNGVVGYELSKAWQADHCHAAAVTRWAPLWLRIDGADIATVVVWLYSVMTIVSLVLALSGLLFPSRRATAPEAEIQQWRRVAWLSALPPTIYMAIGPWCGGGYLWRGDAPWYRWAATCAYVLIFLGLTQWTKRKSGLFPTQN